jgi:hypothetical protein
MIKPFLAATMLVLSTSIAFADDGGSITAKAMHDHPGTMGGTTANATAKPNSGSLTERQMQNQPGVNSDTKGMTATPNAKPDSGSISSKEMQDNPGARK